MQSAVESEVRGRRDRLFYCNHQTGSNTSQSNQKLTKNSAPTSADVSIKDHCNVEQLQDLIPPRVGYEKH